MSTYCKCQHMASAYMCQHVASAYMCQHIASAYMCQHIASVKTWWVPTCDKCQHMTSAYMWQVSTYDKCLHVTSVNILQVSTHDKWWQVLSHYLIIVVWQLSACTIYIHIGSSVTSVSIALSIYNHSSVASVHTLSLMVICGILFYCHFNVLLLFF